MCRASAIRTDDSCIVLKVRFFPHVLVPRFIISLVIFYQWHFFFGFFPLKCDFLLLVQTLPCLVRMCSKEHLLEERVEGAETLAYLMEPDVELQRIASTTDHLVAMLADYFKYPSSVSAITDIKRVSRVCTVKQF